MIDEILEVGRTIKQPRTTLGVLCKSMEELGELAQAINKNQGYEEVVSEVADVIIAITDVGLNAAIDVGEQDKYEADLMIAIRKKLSKWIQVYSK